MTVLMTVDEFLRAPGPVLDVRSLAEYEQGHIPGAVSFPLFSNEERSQVGICYKHEGREAAIELGLELVGPKLAGFVRRAKEVAGDRQVRVHCWRGGMRSGSMGWLLETAGMRVATLEGGYKAFRGWVREQLATPKQIISLAGMTGTGKTAILQALAEQGEQILDLEALANHRGSSYGNLGLPPQPSTEHYENLIAVQWASLDPDRSIWIEAESRRVGTCRIPDELFNPMMQAPILQIERSRSERIANLLQDYGTVDPADLIVATERIRKRLGGLRMQQAVEHIQTGELAIAADIILDYYDKAYTFDLQRRSEVPFYTCDVTGLSPSESARRLMAEASARLTPTLVSSSH